MNLTREQVEELLNKKPSMFNCAVLMDLLKMYDLFDHIRDKLKEEDNIDLKIDFDGGN